MTDTDQEREDEVLRPAAHLPDALVGALPVVRHPVHQPAQVAPARKSRNLPKAAEADTPARSLRV